jgi:hypothetical protein
VLWAVVVWLPEPFKMEKAKKDGSNMGGWMYNR